MTRTVVATAAEAGSGAASFHGARFARLLAAALPIGDIAGFARPAGSSLANAAPDSPAQNNSTNDRDVTGSLP